MLGRVQGLRPRFARRLRRPGPDLRAPLRTWEVLARKAREGGFLTLKIYPVVLELVRRVSPLLPKVRSRSYALGDQLERAQLSIPLNVAEGSYSRGKNRQARYQTAAASAREALACFETAEALGWSLDAELAALFQRVIGTLVRLALSGR